ncbi:flagellar hook-length control protein FliK [Neobacillus sp. Marseille-QA0830]
MIQLAAIQNQLSKQPSKTTGKEGEPTAAFDLLLQLSSQEEEPESEPNADLPQLLLFPFLQQAGRINQLCPNAGNPDVESNQEGLLQPVVVTTGDIPAALLPEHPDIPAMELQTKDGVTGEQQSGTGTFQVLDGRSLAEPTLNKEEAIPFQMQTKEDVSGWDSPQKATDDVQVVNLTPQVMVSSGNEMTTQAMVAPSGDPTDMPAQTVRADRFDQDITQFIESAIQVSGSEDGIEAAFTLVPKHLGKVEVKVKIQDGQVTAEFLTSTPLGKDLLETNVQALRSSLETQGLQVAKIDITQQIQSPALNFMGTLSQRGDSHGRQGQQPDSRKRGGLQAIQPQEEYREYDLPIDGASQINTTA